LKTSKKHLILALFNFLVWLFGYIYIYIYIYSQRKNKEKGLVMKKPHEVGALMEMKSQMSLQIGSKIMCK
jgi:predicted membrane protein